MPKKGRLGKFADLRGAWKGGGIFEGGWYPDIHYRALEKDKTVDLKKSSGNFDKIVEKISVKEFDELNLWLTEIPQARRNIHLTDIDFTIHTDASEIGE